MSGQLSLRNKKKFKFSGGFRKRRAHEIQNTIKSYTNFKRTSNIIESIGDGDRRESIASEARVINTDTEEEYISEFELNSAEYSCDEESDDKTSEFNYDRFAQELSQWALKNNIKHEHLKGLLKIWNDLVPLKSLPSDPRTLLQTPREVALGHENYWHHGLRKCLSNRLRNIPSIPELLSLRFNLDGIPLSKSSSVDCWPILVDICELREIPPCVVGIYCGKSKPYNYTCAVLIIILISM